MRCSRSRVLAAGAPSWRGTICQACASSVGNCRTPTSPVRRSYGADLRGSRFDSATLFACDFRQSNMENVSMRHADLRGCFFAGAVMVGANLFEADLRPGTQISRDKTGEFHVVAPQQRPGAASAAGFSGANLTNASLAGVVAVQTDLLRGGDARLQAGARTCPRRQFHRLQSSGCRLRPGRHARRLLPRRRHHRGELRIYRSPGWRRLARRAVGQAERTAAGRTECHPGRAAAEAHQEFIDTCGAAGWRSTSAGSICAVCQGHSPGMRLAWTMLDSAASGVLRPRSIGHHRTTGGTLPTRPTSVAAGLMERTWRGIDLAGGRR